jgi:invasion protein IalB
MGWVVVVLLASLMTPSAVQADTRVALVIGNGEYVRVGKLTNPINDADAVAALLRAAKFDVVEAKRDLGVASMRRALRDFSDHVRSADIAVVFYAGHGIEVNGTNYLIPVDAALERDIDVEDETVSLDRVSQVLDSAKRLRLVILDACRDNPFVRSMKRTLSGRSIGRGLAKVDVLSSDTLIAFAARAGATAADGESSNSPYTMALIRHLTTPGLDLRLAFGRIRDDVLKSTGSRQEPSIYGSLGGAEVSLVTAATPTAPSQAGLPTVGEAERVWMITKDTTSVAALESFAARYRDTIFADLARGRINELKRQASVAPPAPAPASLQPAPTVTAPPPLPPPQAPPPAQGQSAWVKLCEKTASSQNACATHHERIDGTTGTVLLSATFRRIEGQDKQQFRLIVPLGLLLQPGLRVGIFPPDLWAKAQNSETLTKAEEGRVRSLTLKYTICHTTGCAADMEASPDVVADFRRSGGFLASAINPSGAPVALPVPLTGFDQALAGQPIDTRKYLDARRTLMAQIAERQKALGIDTKALLPTIPSPFAASSKVPPLSPRTVLQYPEIGWTRLCEIATAKDKDGRDTSYRICLTHHERLQGDKALVSTAIREIDGQSAKQLMAMVPLGVSLARGVRAYVLNGSQWSRLLATGAGAEAGESIPLPYTLCHAMGCTAEAEATPSLLSQLKQGEGLAVVATNEEQQTLVYPVPLSGFATAFAGPPAASADYAARRKALMEQGARQR